MQSSIACSVLPHLKLHFDLNYKEHQAISSGRAEEAAQWIIARRNANSRGFALGPAVLSGVAIAIWGTFGVGFAMLLLLETIASFARDRLGIRKVRALQEKSDLTRQESA